MGKVLITGATGYIGHHLVKRLLEEGYELILIIRNKEKIHKEIRDNINICIIEVDISDERSTQIIKEKIDAIFHLAADTKINGDLNELNKINVTGTRNILDLAVRNNVRKFIFASSIEAVGPVSLNNIPVDESISLNPVSAYGKTKADAENLVKSFNKENNLEIVIARIGTVYGLHRRFIFPIVERIMKSTGFSYQEYPFQNRYIHPIYITDLIEMLYESLIESKAGSQTYFFVGDEYIEFRALSKVIADKLNKKLFFKGKRPKLSNDCVHMAYTNKKAKQDLQLSSLVDINAGIEKTIEWYFKNKYLPFKFNLKQAAVCLIKRLIYKFGFYTLE